MDAALMNAIDNDGLRGRQVVLASNASPRLDTTKLPLIQLTEHGDLLILSSAAATDMLACKSFM
jgi:hypothetical protein